MSDLLEEFSIEASELLEEAEESLLEIESGRDIEGNFNRVFRSFHSLKGSAGMMGFEDIQKHMHLSEDRFESFKETKDELPQNIEYFLACVDHCRRLLAGEVAEFSHESFNSKSSAPVNEVDPSKASLPVGKVFLVDVIGLDVSNSDFFKGISQYVVTNVVTDLNSYLKNKNYASIDALFIDNSIIDEFNKAIKDQIPVLVMGKVHPDDNTDNILATEVEKFDLEHIKTLLKYSQMLNRSIGIIEKSIRLLFYQFSDLDKYLAQNGKEQVRVTLREEINSILGERSGVFK